MINQHISAEGSALLTIVSFRLFPNINLNYRSLLRAFGEQRKLVSKMAFGKIAHDAESVHEDHWLMNTRANVTYD